MPGRSEQATVAIARNCSKGASGQARSPWRLEPRPRFQPRQEGSRSRALRQLRTGGQQSASSLCEGTGRQHQRLISAIQQLDVTPRVWRPHCQTLCVPGCPAQLLKEAILAKLPGFMNYRELQGSGPLPGCSADPRKMSQSSTPETAHRGSCRMARLPQSCEGKARRSKPHLKETSW